MTLIHTKQAGKRATELRAELLKLKGTSQLMEGEVCPLICGAHGLCQSSPSPAETFQSSWHEPTRGALTTGCLVSGYHSCTSPGLPSHLGLPSFHSEETSKHFAGYRSTSLILKVRLSTNTQTSSLKHQRLPDGYRDNATAVL